MTLVSKICHKDISPFLYKPLKFNGKYFILLYLIFDSQRLRVSEGGRLGEYLCFALSRTSKTRYRGTNWTDLNGFFFKVVDRGCARILSNERFSEFLLYVMFKPPHYTDHPGLEISVN